MKKTILTLFIGVMTLSSLAQKKVKAEKPSTPQQDREFWVKSLYKIAYPVIHNLAEGTLKQNMPVEIPVISPQNVNYYKRVTYLEAVGRTLAGVAPWLALPDDDTAEGQLRKKMRLEALKGIANAVNPDNPDYINFKTDSQPIVDAAYFAQAFIRAPKALWEPLDSITKKRVATELKRLRNRSGAYNNWLLFAGITETFLMSVGEDSDPARINFARNKIREWYVGDGWYSDGAHFSMDFYNDYVIHPMLVDMLKVLVDKKRAPQSEYDQALKRMIRHSEFSERIISPEGTFPIMGRSSTYRSAAFQTLAQVALMEKLPSFIQPAQVRSALTAVYKNLYQGNQNFDENGWLVLGFNGHQPEIADYYTSTGSLYMATLGFLTLGLPADNKFWTDAPADWTSKKGWKSEKIKKDYAVDY